MSSYMKEPPPLLPYSPDPHTILYFVSFLNLLFGTNFNLRCRWVVQRCRWRQWRIARRKDYDFQPLEYTYTYTRVRAHTHIPNSTIPELFWIDQISHILIKFNKWHFFCCQLKLVSLKISHVMQRLVFGRLSNLTRPISSNEHLLSLSWDDKLANINKGMIPEKKNQHFSSSGKTNLVF